nr:hypothetical protein B0A51_10947 [Rachicladosporium sp. CCFEE 5018]
MSFMDEMIDSLNSDIFMSEPSLDLTGTQRHSVVSVPLEAPLRITKPLRKSSSLTLLRLSSSTWAQDAPVSPLTANADHEPLKWAQPDFSACSPTSTRSRASTRKSSTTSMTSTAASSVSAVSPTRSASRGVPAFLKQTKSFTKLAGWHRHADQSTPPPTPPIPTSPARSRQASVSTWNSESSKSPFSQVEEYGHQLQRILSTRRTRKRTATPQAEIEMVPKMHDLNYFRPFTTNISAGTAMCGAYMLANKSDLAPWPTLFTSTHKTPACDALSLALLIATTSDQILSALTAATLPDILFALHQSLTSASLPRVPIRQAKTLYKHTDTYLSTYSTRSWSRIRDLLSRIPTPCLVTLAFLVTIGRALEDKGVTVDGLRAGVWLLRVMWPQVEIREVTDGDVEEGDAVTGLLTEFIEELLSEVPGEVRSVRWRGGGKGYGFGDGVDLMSLLHDKALA